mmetsp:Transcript_7120/g.17269  ORF Transcript_7120/g.17269 Transcript_7120/m.17269 type:complete len:304 (+) Transcript_7120:156-1067(+)
MLPATEQLYHEAIGNDLFHFPRIVRYLAPTQFEPPRQGCVNVSDPKKPVDPRCPIGWEFANGYCFAGHDYTGPCRRVETFATPVYSEFRIRLPEDPQPPGGPETPEAGGGTPAPANGGTAALASMSWYRSLPLTKWREDISQAVSHQLAQYATKCGVSWACPPTSQQTPVTGKCPKKLDGVEREGLPREVPDARGSPLHRVQYVFRHRAEQRSLLLPERGAAEQVPGVRAASRPVQFSEGGHGAPRAAGRGVRPGMEPAATAKSGAGRDCSTNKCVRKFWGGSGHSRGRKRPGRTATSDLGRD